MSKITPARYFVLLFLLVAAVCTNAQQTEFTWTGGGKADNGFVYANYWNDPRNWGNPLEGEFPSGVGVTINLNVSGNIRLDTSRTVSVVNIGVSSGNGTVGFSGGGAANTLILQAPESEMAQINKTQGNADSFSRPVQFSSDTVITVTKGTLSFNGTTGQAAIRGAGDAYFRGSGGRSIVNNSITDLSTGNFIVDQNGTLEFNATIAAVNGTYFRVADTGTLLGTGTINRQTSVESGGTLAPGSSPGIMTFGTGLTLEDGSHFSFELIGNTSDNRGTSFDGVNVTGGDLIIGSGAIFDITLNGTGSTVNYSGEFWQSNQSWLVFENSEGVTVTFDSFVIGNISVDAFGQDFPIAGGSFSFAQIDNNIHLVYTAVPEPGT